MAAIAAGRARCRRPGRLSAALPDPNGTLADTRGALACKFLTSLTSLLRTRLESEERCVIIRAVRKTVAMPGSTLLVTSDAASIAYYQFS